MSIEKTVFTQRLQTGELQEVHPRIAHDRRYRTAYVTRRLVDDLASLGAANRDQQSRIASLRVDIETFVTSESLDQKYISPLDRNRPRGIWEVRSTRPLPQLRVLGGFAAKNTLVLFSLHHRTHLAKKGAGNDTAVDAAVQQLLRGWRSIFGNDSSPMTSSASELIDGYIEHEIPL